MNDISCILVPDVHGRTFWKDAKNYKDCDIVFLGDYLDPYDFEHITPESAIDNFIEIIDFAKSNPRVTLLLGNHDCEYAINTNVCDCRCDYRSFNKIRDIFFENADLFKFAVKRSYGKDFLFSHAGLHPKWLGRHGFSVDDVCNVKYQKHFDTNEDNYKFIDALCDVSWYRGGWNDAGSSVWSDIREYVQYDKEAINLEQIVGHTMLKDQPAGIDGITCIDVRRIFLIDKLGNLCEKDLSPANVFKL